MRLSRLEQKRIIRIHFRKQLLKQRGIRYHHLGKPSTVSAVIHEERRNLPMRRKIARVLHVDYRELWPTAA